MGSSSPPTFAVKVFDPSGSGWDKERVTIERDSLADSIRTQLKVSAGDGPHWAPVLESGTAEDKPFFVTKYYRRSVQWLIDRPFKLSSRHLHAIVSSVVEGLRELKWICRRPHGNLKPSNVLIEGEGRIKQGKVVLTDPLPTARLDAEASEAADLQATGTLIYQLVLRRPFRLMGGWPVPPSEAWSRLGRYGETWRKLCDRLLDPDPARSQCSLATVAETLRLMEKPRKVRKYAAVGAAAAAVVVVLLLILFWRLGLPKIKLLGDDPMTVEVGTEFKDPGCTATDRQDGDLTGKVKVTGSVDVRKLGDDPMTVEVGTEFKDPGCTATDRQDGDLTGKVKVTGSVDVRKLGEYSLTYRVTDSSGNERTETRTVRVVDTTAPVITLRGDSTVTLGVGNAYKEPGYIADDNYDGDITGKVVVEGSVDHNKLGEYPLGYKVTDSSGNQLRVRRTVHVVDTEPVPPKFDFRAFWAKYVADFRQPNEFKKHYASEQDLQWYKVLNLKPLRIEWHERELFAPQDDEGEKVVFEVKFTAWFEGIFGGDPVRQDIKEVWVIAPDPKAPKIVEVRKPRVSVSLPKLDHTCVQGTDAKPRKLEVWNSGKGTLEYSISIQYSGDVRDWLSCKPTSGTSTGERDGIDVNFPTSDLPPGPYSATITVKREGATNTPQTIPVNLIVKLKFNWEDFKQRYAEAFPSPDEFKEFYAPSCWPRPWYLPKSGPKEASVSEAKGSKLMEDGEKYRVTVNIPHTYEGKRGSWAVGERWVIEPSKGPEKKGLIVEAEVI